MRKKASNAIVIVTTIFDIVHGKEFVSHNDHDLRTLKFTDLATTNVQVLLWSLGFGVLLALYLIYDIHISVNPTRRRRSIENIEAPNASFSSLANYLTNFECGKNLLCELEAKFTYELDPDETLILNLFKNHVLILPESKIANYEYDLTERLGLSPFQVVCRHGFTKCPYHSEDMMKYIRSFYL